MSSSRDPITATTTTNGYTPEQGDALARAAGQAGFDQLAAGLNYIIKLLEDNGIAYAVMGGLALNFRGSERETHDVDVTPACDMHTLRQICRGRSR